VRERPALRAADGGRDSRFGDLAPPPRVGGLEPHCDEPIGALRILRAHRKLRRLPARGTRQIGGRGVVSADEHAPLARSPATHHEPRLAGGLELLGRVSRAVQARRLGRRGRDGALARELPDELRDDDEPPAPRLVVGCGGGPSDAREGGCGDHAKGHRSSRRVDQTRGRIARAFVDQDAAARPRRVRRIDAAIVLPGPAAACHALGSANEVSANRALGLEPAAVKGPAQSRARIAQKPQGDARRPVPVVVWRPIAPMPRHRTASATNRKGAGYVESKECD
jgi:hypothetical protein